MEETPDFPEVAIFRSFVNKLNSLQQQLDKQSHGYHFLPDRLLTAVDIPHIQNAFRCHMPRTSEQGINHIALKLSDHPKTAGTITAAHLTQEDIHCNRPT